MVLKLLLLLISKFFNKTQFVVATAFYRLLPDIKLVKEIEGEAAERLQKCFSPGVIALRHQDDKKIAVVNDPRYDTSSRNVFRHEDLKDAVVMSKIQDHFICKYNIRSVHKFVMNYFLVTIESVGALKADVIFIEAVKILKNKCVALYEEIKQM